MPDRKIIFCCKSDIKTFQSYCCKCWHWKSTVSAYIVWYVFGAHTGEIWTKSYGPIYTKFWFFFWRKPDFLKTIFDKVLTLFCKTFVQPKQMFNCKLLTFRLLPFSVAKIMVLQHQVKSCTKHGRPDQYATLSQ